MNGILKAIGGFFTGLIKKIIGKDDVIVQLPADMPITPELIDSCIKTVNNIKNAVNSGVAVLLTTIIPGTLDDVIRQKIGDAATVTLAGLTFSKEFLTTQNKDVLLNDLLNKIKFADDADKDALYHSLAARLIVVVSDGKVTWSEAVSIIELYFKQVFTNQ